MPSEVSVAGAHHDREPTVEELRRDLAETLRREAATANLLRVISRAQFDLPPILDAIAEDAVKVCRAERASIFLCDGGLLHATAGYNVSANLQEFLNRNPIRPGSNTATARCALLKESVQIEDVRADPEYTYAAKDVDPMRTVLAVPMLTGEELLGVIVIFRHTIQPFTPQQVRMLETFADQAAIAINGARAFHEAQGRAQDQEATSAILSIISQSRGVLQPVIDLIANTSCKLCQADFANVFLKAADGFHLRAQSGAAFEFSVQAELATAVLRPGRETVVGRVAANRAVVHILDIQDDPDLTFFRERGVETRRTALGVPLIQQGHVVGVISVGRNHKVKPFTDRQIALLKTFADQVVIAVENTRLFEAEQASKRELLESLEYQTAISDVLSVISRSPSKLQPVLEAIVETARRLCQSDRAIFFQLRDGCYHLAAERGTDPEFLGWLRDNPMSPELGSGSTVGRAARERRTIHVPDLAGDPEYNESPIQRRGRARSRLAVPLLRDDVVFGVILVARDAVRPFTDRQIKLVETFADQAVIAIENTRLLEEVEARTRELTESLEYQTATSDVLGVINRSKFDLKPVLDTIARVASSLCANDVTIQLRDGEELRAAAHHGPLLMYLDSRRPIGRDWVSGRAVVDMKPIHVKDLASAGDEFTFGRDLARQFGHRTTLAIPLMREDEAVGCLLLRRLVVEPFSEKQISLLQTFADQAVIAIENTRLFEEIAQKSKELEIASQHKSQFIANMSHELRTPLAAILGYAELMQEGFYGDQSEKSMNALTRIRSNGKHLLGLINTVLDIAKIESGQFTLNMSEYAIESVIETVRVATESLAQNRKLALKTEVAKSLPIGLGDEQRLTQVLLNLVGNAIKFTDTGEVRVTAKAVNGHFNVSVTDTGPGIPEEHQARIFEQFHQVDSSNTKAKGGTGLGLAIAKQIVEMHGGRIWVESTLGKGSTFQMELPARAELRKPAS